MTINKKETQSIIISTLNGSTFRGDGSKENPLTQIIEQESVCELITKVMIYASFFQAAMFFTYRGVIASYDNESREFLLETDHEHILKRALQDVLGGRDSAPAVVESNPLLRRIK